MTKHFLVTTAFVLGSLTAPSWAAGDATSDTAEVGSVRERMNVSGATEGLAGGTVDVIEGVGVAESLSPAAIARLQLALAQAGQYAGLPHGEWDEATQAAVRRFQMSREMEPSGLLTPMTLAALGLADLPSETADAITGDEADAAEAEENAEDGGS